MLLKNASPPLLPLNSSCGRFEGASTFLQNLQKLVEIISFNSRATDGKASALQPSFAAVYHESKECIATLIYLDFEWWKFGSRIKNPSASQLRPSRDERGTERSLSHLCESP